jgi:hypothetical protein
MGVGVGLGIGVLVGVGAGGSVALGTGDGVGDGIDSPGKGVAKYKSAGGDGCEARSADAPPPWRESDRLLETGSASFSGEVHLAMTRIANKEQATSRAMYLVWVAMS